MQVSSRFPISSSLTVLTRGKVSSVNWSILLLHVRITASVWPIAANSTHQQKQFVHETNLKRNAAKLHFFTPRFSEFETCKGLSVWSDMNSVSPIRQSEQRSVAQVSLWGRSGECGIALMPCPHAYCRRLRFLCILLLIACIHFCLGGFVSSTCWS